MQPGPVDDSASLWAVMYLVAAMLLITVFAIAGLMLRGELSDQADLEAQSVEDISVQNLPSSRSQRGLWGWRHH